MIIEAEPRRGVGQLEGYINYRKKPFTEQFTVSHSNSSKGRKSKSFKGTSSTADLLVEKVGSVARIKYGKTLYRDHPYEREETAQSNFDQSTSSQRIAGDISQRFWQKPVSLRACFHRSRSKEDVASGVKKNSFNLQNANVNENNDNCPSTTCHDGAIGISSSLPDNLTICEVEIEDLIDPNATDCLKKIHGFRRRRRSFNTNPHSSSEGRVSPATRHHLQPFDHPHSKEYTGCYPAEAHSTKTVGGQINKPYIRQILRLSPEKQRGSNWPIPAGTDHSRDIQKLSKSSDNAKNLTSSIEKLVQFFEANSPTDDLQADEEHIIEESSSQQVASYASNTIRWKHLQRTAYSSQNITQPSVRPFSCQGVSSNNSKRVTFTIISHSGGFNLTPENEENPDLLGAVSGRIYNNNGNATSAHRDCKIERDWTNYCAPDRLTQAFYQKNQRKSGIQNLSTSESFLPTHRGRKVPSSLLSRVSDDVELIDLESTRLSSWPGTQSIPAAVERQPHQLLRSSSSALYGIEELIELQTNRAQHHSNRFSSFSLPPDNPKYPRGSPRRFQAAKENPKELRHDNSSRNHGRASANNHHNNPGAFDQRFSSEFSQGQNFCLNNTEKSFTFGHFACHSSSSRRKPQFRHTDPCEMGCIQSIAKTKVSPDKCHHGIIVEDITAAIDRVPTEIEEKSPIVLRYRTPYFRASAHVIVPPVPRKETWTVGWIQACDAMKFINQYGNIGNSSWEIPALKDRRVSAVSDSDGVSYPWYGNTTEIATIEGPTDTSRSLTLRMNDNFYPSVTWDIPVGEGSEAHLTHITRDQSFTTWLAAVNQTTGRLEVLRTVKWHFYLEIDVDPTRELGERACIVSPMVQKQPVILKNNTEPIYISSPYRGTPSASGVNGGRPKRLNRRPCTGGDNNSNNHTNTIPKSALVRPSANNAQTLIWRPVGDLPVIVVPAKEEYKENNEIVWFTRTPTMHGHDHNVRVLSLQEMAKLKKSMSR